MKYLSSDYGSGSRGNGLLHMSDYENPFKKNYTSRFEIEIEEIHK